MREVLGGKLQSRMTTLTGGSQLGGSCMSLSTVGFSRHQTRSCSLETILDDCAPLTRQQLFMSTDSLASYSTVSQDDSPPIPTLHRQADCLSKTGLVSCQNAPGGTTRKRLSSVSVGRLSGPQPAGPLRPRSVGSCLDIVIESKEENAKDCKMQGRSTSCLNVNTPIEQHCPSSTSCPSSSCTPHTSVSSSSSSALAKAQAPHMRTGPSQPRPASSTSNLWTLPPPTVVRRCLSSLDLSKPARPASLFRPPFFAPASRSMPPQPKPEHSKTLSPLPVCVSACLLTLNQTNPI